MSQNLLKIQNPPKKLKRKATAKLSTIWLAILVLSLVAIIVEGGLLVRIKTKMSVVESAQEKN